MLSDKNAPRLLGFAFFFVAVLSLVSGLPLDSYGIALIGESENISFTMVDVASNQSTVRLSIIGYLIESCSIVLLAVLLYHVLRPHNQILATWGLGLWLAEAVFVAVRQISVYGLLRISIEFVESGLTTSLNLLTFGTLFYQLFQFIYASQMIFYTVGGLIFYYLFFASRTVPRWLSLWGLIAASLGLVGELLVLLGNNVLMFAFLPILPFELAIGIWLMAKGTKEEKQ